MLCACGPVSVASNEWFSLLTNGEVVPSSSMADTDTDDDKVLFLH